jgi:hypothetical protein
MHEKRSAVEQRRGQITAQVERLRRQLASKTRKDYSTDFRYETWIKQSRALIDELFDELSILDEPGEYDELPFAVVADELGLRLDQIRLLIKFGEVEATGRRAHERVSRRELERLATLEAGELLRLAAQDADAVFHEVVAQLRGGDVTSAERSYQRLKARQTCVGNHALATEVAIKLTKGMYEEADRAIRFILTEKPYDRVPIGECVAEFVRGVCFRDDGVRAIISDVLKPLVAIPPKATQAEGTTEDLQAAAMCITAVVVEGLEESLRQSSSALPRGELRELIRDRIFTALYAEANSPTSTKSRQFILDVRQKLTQFWEPAKLLEQLRED